VNRQSWRFRAVVAGGAAALGLAACGAPEDETASTEYYTPVTLQLQWTAQAQFGGYLAAAALGYYEDEGLDVEFAEFDMTLASELQAASGAADFAIAWVPKALQAREKGAELTNIAQVFQRSGTVQVAWADSGISTVADLEGKKVGSWGFGNEIELFAGLASVGLDVDEDVTIVEQPFDMELLLNREIDAAQAETYNELAQLLEAVNPDTGELYKIEDFNVIDWNDVGTAMLQDAIWAHTSRLAEDEEYAETARKLVKASLKGWIYCRDNPDECVQFVLDAGPALGASHQTWQMARINELVWPSPEGIGMMNADLWEQTVQVATGNGVIAAAPTDDAYATEYAEAALAELREEGLDVVGDGYTAPTVELTEGGR
jgi:NitT/TauT family transport system substrate-binding protein